MVSNDTNLKRPRAKTGLGVLGQRYDLKMPSTVSQHSLQFID